MKPDQIELDLESMLTTASFDEYILISDNTSEVLSSLNNLPDILAQAKMIRKAGGSATVFKATKY